MKAKHRLAPTTWTPPRAYYRSLWPLATVAHRLWRAARTCAAADRAAGAPVAASATAGDLPDADPQGLLGVVLWRWHRGTVPFDLHAGAVIAMLVFWNIPETDGLRELMARWVGA